MSANPYEPVRLAMRDVWERSGGLEAARKHVRDYWFDEPYTGRYFDRLKDGEHPNRITERDVVAVSMLGVEIPAPVTVWLMSAEGSSEVKSLLSKIPPEADFWTDPHLLDEDREMWRLWRLLETGCWPTARSGNGMGTTKISKLLATKRPRLVPIYDSVIEGQLGPVDNYWAAFRYALDEETRFLFAMATLEAPADVSFLRRVDALLWMFGTRGQLLHSELTPTA